MDSCTRTQCKWGRTCVPSLIRPTKLMLVLEAPGYRELEEMTPLVGPAGKLNEKFFNAVGLSRKDVSIANTCGCVDMTREDRRPLPAEIEACRPRLLEDIARANPQVILSMGNISQQFFFPGGQSVGKIRGKIRNWNGRLVIPTYHPAAALPHRSPEVGDLIIADLITALSLIQP